MFSPWVHVQYIRSSLQCKSWVLCSRRILVASSGPVRVSSQANFGSSLYGFSAVHSLWLDQLRRAPCGFCVLQERARQRGIGSLTGCTDRVGCEGKMSSRLEVSRPLLSHLMEKSMEKRKGQQGERAVWHLSWAEVLPERESGQAVSGCVATWSKIKVYSTVDEVPNISISISISLNSFRLPHL